MSDGLLVDAECIPDLAMSKNTYHLIPVVFALTTLRTQV